LATKPLRTSAVTRVLTTVAVGPMQPLQMPLQHLGRSKSQCRPGLPHTPAEPLSPLQVLHGCGEQDCSRLSTSTEPQAPGRHSPVLRAQAIGIDDTCMTDIDYDFVTAGEAASLLGVPKRTLLYWLSRGNLPGTLVAGRLWLVPWAEVERWRGRGQMQQPARSLRVVSKPPPPGYPSEVDGPAAASTGSGPGEPDI
jgi:excisionase family DNA binding protein